MGATFFMSKPLPAVKARRWASPFASGSFVGPLVFVLRSSDLVGQAKGWRLFMIADDWATFPSDPSPRSLVARNELLHPQTDARGPKAKDRPIDPMSGKNSPAKEPEPVSSLCESGRAPALHAASVS